MNTLSPESQRSILRAVLLITIILSSTAQAASPFTTEGKFSVGSDGSANYSIPIVVPPGTAGMQPQLALNYNSNGGNGIVGMGWGIDGLSQISRCPTTLEQDGVINGVNYTSTDRFCLDGQRLIATTDSYVTHPTDSTRKIYTTTSAYGANGTEYCTESANFAKIISYGQAGTGPAYFKVWTKSGQIIEYGNTVDSGIEAQGKPTIRTWGVNKISDTKGNYIAVTYTEDNANGEAYVQKIDYTGNAASTPALTPYANVQFIYETRPDTNTAYQAGSVLKTTKRLTNIQTFNATTLIKNYKLTYELSQATNRSRLKAVQECDGDSTSNCKQPVALIFSDSPPGNFANMGSLTSYYQWTQPTIADFNGDGKDDVLINTTTPNAGWYVYLSNGDGTFKFTGSLTPYYQWTQPTIADFNGDGKDDVLINTTTPNAGWYVYLSNGDGTFKFTGSLTPYYQWTQPTIADFNGDGKDDVLINTTTPNAGWYVYLSNGDGTFKFTGSLTPYYQWTQPTIADFNGDGKSDVLINTVTAGAGWAVYLSKGDGTFISTASLTPYYQWTQPTIADFNGDGKSDVLINTVTAGAGWAVYLSKGDGTFTSATSLTPYYQWTQPTIADFNGDGKSDVLINTVTAGAGWAVYLSKGDGTFTSATSLTPYYQWTQPTIADFNGDGKSDVLINTTTPNAGWYVYLSIGDGTFKFTGSLTPYYQWTQPTVADFNGDGKSDIIINTVTPGAGWYVYQTSYGVTDLLQSLGSSGTSVVSLNHKAITDGTIYVKDTSGSAGTAFCPMPIGESGMTNSRPIQNLQEPVYVVSSYTNSDGVGGVVTTNYQYGGLKSHLRGRGSLGFRYVKESSPDSGLGVTTFYRQDFPFIGLPCQVEKRRLSDNALLSVVQNTYANSDLATSTIISKFPYLSQSVEQAYELDSSLVSTTTTTNQYDDYGNVTLVKVDDGLGNIKTTTSTYSNNVGNWLLGRLIRSTVTSVTP